MTPGKRHHPPGSAGADRRAAPRERVSAEAEILLKTGTIKCRLVDISETGARLAIGRTFGLPQRLHIRIGRLSFEATLVRSKTGEIAVRFV